VLANKYFATLQYSQKKFGFVGAGGTNTAVSASPFRTRGVTPGESSGLLYAAPFFSALDPENRDNKQFTGSLSYTLSTTSAGTHDLKGGGEYYRSSRTGGNSQSATNYVFQSDYLRRAASRCTTRRVCRFPCSRPVSRASRTGCRSSAR
jgi:hypothetical protein